MDRDHKRSNSSGLMGFFFSPQHGSLKSLPNVEASENHLIGVRAQIKPGNVGVVPAQMQGGVKGGNRGGKEGRGNCRRNSFG